MFAVSAKTGKTELRSPTKGDVAVRTVKRKVEAIAGTVIDRINAGTGSSRASKRFRSDGRASRSAEDKILKSE